MDYLRPDSIRRGNLIIDFEPEEDMGEDEGGVLRFWFMYVDENGEENEFDDGSYCTNIPADTDADTKKKLLTLLMDRLENHVGAGPYDDNTYVKKLGEELSWIEPSWLDKSLKK